MRKNRSKYVINKEISHREMEDQIVLLPPDRHALHTLNESGRYVWMQLSKQKSPSEIIKAFAIKFNISEKKAKADVLSFIKKLEKMRIIRKK